MSEPILRRATEDEDRPIRDLLREAFPDNPKAEPAFTKWQYWENPFGEARTWVYEDNGRLVGVYTGVPVPILIQGRTAVAALGIDAAIAPTHQGRRLFSPLSRALYDDLGEQGMTYTLAYPSTPSRAGITRAGWVEVARLRVNVLALDDRWVATRFHVPSPIAKVARALAFRVNRRSRGAQVDGVPEGVTTLFWDELGSGTTMSGIIRDDAWWNWRYAANPEAPYRYYESRRNGRLRGAAVTTTREAFGSRFGYILEFLAEDATAASELVAAMAHDETDVVGLAIITIAGSRHDVNSRRAGLRRLPRRLEPIPQYFGAVPNVPGAPDPSTLPWTVSWGDLDHL